MALDYNIIGSRIKDARLSKHMTQEDLSERLNVSVAFLSRVERGNSRINLKRLNQISNILEVSEGYLLTGSASNQKNYLDKEFAELLASCSPEKRKLIYNIAKTIAESED
jgi:transcriptional regulator with XRE-family HTH domain